MKKARKKALNELESRDATDEAFRKLIEDELSEIKREVQGFSQAILSAGVDFLHQGVIKLKRVTAALATESTGQDACATQGNAGDCVTDGGAFATAAINDMKFANLDEDTKNLLADAKDRFRESRISATKAFNNHAHSTDKRILALKIRLMAAVLECVDRPHHALDDCHECIRQLHEMRAVQEHFKVQLYGGFKAAFEKNEREEMIFAVCQMNYVAFRLIQVITGDNSEAITLPALEVKGEQIDTLRDERVMQELVELEMAEFCRGAWALGKEGKSEQKLKQPCRVASNSQGQFIVEDAGSGKRGIKLYSPGGKFVRRFEKSVFPSGVHSMATDDRNDVYVLADADDTNQTQEVYVFNQFGTRNNNKTISLEEHFWGISLAVGPGHQLFVLGLNGPKNVSYIVVHDIIEDEIIQTGLGRGVLNNPSDVAVAADGRVFVLTVPGTPTVQTFNTQAGHLQTFPLSGNLCTEGSIGICRDCRTLVVSLWGRNCSENKKLLVFTAEGGRVCEMKVPKSKGKRRSIAKDVAVTVDGRVAVITSTTDAEVSCQIFTVWNGLWTGLGFCVALDDRETTVCVAFQGCTGNWYSTNTPL